jgi:hypothetical protein
LVRTRLEAQHPGERAVRPTSLLWQIFDRDVKDALMIDDLVAYVVTGPEVTSKHVASAIAIGVDVGVTRVIVVAHEGARVRRDAQIEAEQENVRIEFIREDGCSLAPNTNPHV